ncbi:transporter substrate-binding domain-containing protein [Paraburkholderia caballeronis]|uniref:Amino acid ABC transporter substrate-binding protein, PAAT family n=1 Tax=Paraburkholderia caballeronis TaxID=416943 RepID=A0A1H7QM03_9BURK|nr:transporter substrate-binding domain-containing protein [Paraburkholderia caballeronis]PXW22478.1 amino acid ABC transporter substrate-binding protein (PAAT family) [Paraburkholderia caballeronis]PXW96349.1 amino acid ABC transporter substrate-binding protein (PAAT family) [Paraburkholderia caballeronis]RAJ92760.1 amino acid ABC transporter substrate-binding protein (PAAT family) [Paraburkholderia caballeronis]TDV15080.1 amino acid ABC transporter substrate-binding protein (PAAT family) [Par
MKLAVKAALFALACACLPAAHADDYDESGSPALRRIRETGTVTIGVREMAVPFSYYDGSHRAVGYSHAIALRIVDAIRESLGMPSLTVREVIVTPQTRSSLVQNGTIDFECGATAHTRDRDAYMAFSNSIFEYGVRMLVKQGSPVKDFQDLAGRTVVTTASTSQERMLRQWNAARGMNMTILAAKSHAASFDEVKNGRAVAFVMDEPLLYGAKATAPDPGGYAIVGAPTVFEVYACMFRRGDPALKQIADDTIAKMQRSGEAAQLYRQWFESPIPSRGIVLGLPMSARLKELFDNPNDRPLD